MGWCFLVAGCGNVERATRDAPVELAVPDRERNDYGHHDEGSYALR
jgi:hypothetical protein